MAAKETTGNFRLNIPLDASGVTDFKPDRAVKVVAFDGEGRGAYEGVAKLDAKGKGEVALTFKEMPGNLRVVVGPQ